MPDFSRDLVDLDFVSCDQGEEAQLVDDHDELFQSSVRGFEAKSSHSKNSGQLQRRAGCWWSPRLQKMLVRMFGLEASVSGLTLAAPAVLGHIMTTCLFRLLIACCQLLLISSVSVVEKTCS